MFFSISNTLLDRFKRFRFPTYAVYLENVNHAVSEGHLTSVSRFKIVPQILVQVCVIVFSYVRFMANTYIKHSC